MDNFAQSDVTNVAVNKSSARWVAQRFFGQSLDGFIVAGPTLLQIEVGCIAGAMRQQVFDGDAFPALPF